MPAAGKDDARHRSRLAGLDGLRGLAGVGVVLVHVWMYTGNNDPAQPHWLDKVIGELRLGLMAFFVLSAFLLFAPWAAGRAPRTGRFLARRAVRILPAYWAAILGAAALLSEAGSGRAVPAGDLPTFLLMGQTYFDETRMELIPPAWSLCVEVTFYALLPLLGWAALRLAGHVGRRRAVLAIAAALVAVGTVFNAFAVAGGWPVTLTTSLPTYLPVFACGIAAAVLPATGHRRAFLLAGAALVAANAYWHHDSTGALGHVLRDLPAAAGFGLIVAALAAGPPGLLELRPVRWLGTVSYGTYLWHMPVIFVARAQGWLPPDASPALAFAAVLAVSLALATLSWHAVERPALRLGEHRARRGRDRARRGTPATAR